MTLVCWWNSLDSCLPFLAVKDAKATLIEKTMPGAVAEVSVARKGGKDAGCGCNGDKER